MSVRPTVRPSVRPSALAPRTRAGLTAACAALVLATAGAAPAGAVTGGRPDGNAHPGVAAIFSYHDDASLHLCTATLVSPRVLLTAGHCVAQTTGATWVTFDPQVAETAADLPWAQEPAAGYTAAELSAAGLLAGTGVTHPDYAGLTDPKSWNDVGAVVLAQPVSGVQPVPVAGSGTLSRLPKLSGTPVTAVGFGAEVRKPDSGPQQAQPEVFPVQRRVAEVVGRHLSAQLLTVAGNAHDAHGTGGICDGDSGGPTLLDGQVVAVTSYKNSDKCRSQSGMQRVDLPGVQPWLRGLEAAPPTAR